MKKRFLALILTCYLSGINFTSEQQQDLKKIKPIDPIRQARIEFAAQERAREKQKKLRIKKQIAERLIAYIAAKESYLQSQLEFSGYRISSRKNPTDRQLNKKDSKNLGI